MRTRSDTSSIDQFWRDDYEKVSGFIGVKKDLTAWLKTKDVAYTWREIPGGHSFMVWRRLLGEFLPLIFQTP